MGDIRTSWRVNLAVLVALVLFFFLVYALGDSLTPLVFALLFAYMLNPGVESLTRRKLPRWLAVTVLMLFFLFVTLSVLSTLVFVIVKEIPVFLNNLPAYMQTFERDYFPAIKRALGLGAEIELAGLVGQAREELLHLSPQSYASAAGYIASILSGTLNFFLAVFSLLLIPVLMIYILFDYEKMRGAFLGVLPRGYKDEVLSKLGEVETVLKDFAKGQLLVGITLGILYSMGLWVAGVDAPVLIGMGSGLGNMVPYLGTALGLAASLSIAALKYQDILHPALAAGVFAVVQTLEAYVITPKIVGNKLGLHPVVIIVSLLVFGKLFGFIGILIAVPVSAVLKVFLTDFVRDYKESPLYNGGQQ